MLDEPAAVDAEPAALVAIVVDGALVAAPDDCAPEAVEGEFVAMPED